MKKNEYAQLLVEYAKEVGKFLQEHAEDIVPDTDFITDFGIEITFDQEKAFSFPELTVRSGTFCMSSERNYDIQDYIKDNYTKEN